MKCLNMTDSQSLLVRQHRSFITPTFSTAKLWNQLWNTRILWEILLRALSKTPDFVLKICDVLTNFSRNVQWKVSINLKITLTIMLFGTEAKFDAYFANESGQTEAVQVITADLQDLPGHVKGSLDQWWGESQRRLRGDFGHSFSMRWCERWWAKKKEKEKSVK